MFKNIFAERATLNEKAQEQEGNAFTAALMAARKAGDSHFVVAGKKYKCEDYDEQGNIKEKMDPVNKKELKKDFDDRDDKDVDNDGDVDDSDKYLVKRRKAISKASTEDEPKKDGGEEEVVMNPKQDKNKKETKESVSIRDRLMTIWEDAAGEKRKKDQNRDEGGDANSGSAKQMKDGHPIDDTDDREEKSHDDASKAGRTGPTAKARSGGDNIAMGDKKIVNKVKEAYESMYNKEESND